MKGQLTTDALADVLERARQIEAGGTSHGGYEEVILAAEELGISREATVRALQERLGTLTAPPQTGQTVFAKSADGHFYAAKVLSWKDGVAEVRFLSGAEATLHSTDLKAFSLSPGTKVQAYVKSMDSWSGASVVSFNAETGGVTVTSWGSSETVTLDKVRLNGNPSGSRAKTVFWSYAMTAVGSGAVGWLLYWLTHR